jgi:hypothetical protein
MKPETLDMPKPAKRRVLRAILKYLGCYLLGILACIILTPVDLILAGKALWPLYPVLAPIGFFFYYFYLTPQYVFGSVTSYWLVGLIALIPVLFETAAFFWRAPRLRSWRPLWMGFPIGFLGTLGVYYTAAASI